MTKKLSLLPGALALMLTVAPILPAFSQSTAPAPEPRMEKPRTEKWGEKLNLTNDQKAKLKQINESTRTQIEAVLTAEQKAQLQTAKQQQQKMRQNFSALNLTDDQKAKIRTIRESAKQQRDAILTDEQRQQLQQMQQQRRQQRQQRQQPQQSQPTQPGT